VNGVPPPPQVSGAVQLPQSITPPQPSPIGPHVAFADAHVTRPQVALSLGGFESTTPSGGPSGVVW
jgi:hypothetical protein